MRRKTSGKRMQKSMQRKGKDGGGTAKRTYTRKVVVDSDGGSGSDDGSGWEQENAVVGRKRIPALDGKAKEEMKRLADKFREVDEYALDFEEMTGRSSQMKDAR